MSNTFKTLSDLVADAEDLSARLDKSLSPNIRQLKQRVDSSIDDMKRQFKRRMKTARRGGRSPAIPATAVAVVVTLGLLYMAFARSDD